MPDYALCGWVVRMDRPVAGLPPAALGAPVDVTVTLDDAARPDDAWRSAPLHYRFPRDAGEPLSVEVRRDAARGYWFHYGDDTEFTVDHAGARIAAWWPQASTLEDTAAYLLGPVLGFTLRLRHVLALHASAVLVDGRAIALVGPSGAGKSTAAAAFAAAGYPVLADDVLAVRERDDVLEAYPGYQLLRLWESSERMLFGAGDRLPRLTPTWDKRGLALGADYPFHGAPAPLGGIVFLAPRVDEPAAPRVEPVGAGEALMQLVANSYANYLLDETMRAAELRSLERVVRSVPRCRVVPHADPSRLSALVNLILGAVRAG